MFTAVVRISGAGRLADFRERLRWLMVRDADAENYTEHHADDHLEYRFALRRGIPFPAFTLASAEFPELRVEAEWDHDGVRGRALIENGRVVEQSAPTGRPGMEVELGEDGALILGMVCAESEGRCFGYAATADRHTYFRLEAGELHLIAPDAGDGDLEELAFGFIDEWIWFDEASDAAALLERSRYAGYGYAVRGANLKSEKLAQLRERGGRYTTLGAGARQAREALDRQWLTSR